MQQGSIHNHTSCHITRAISTVYLALCVFICQCGLVSWEKLAALQAMHFLVKLSPTKSSTLLCTSLSSLRNLAKLAVPRWAFETPASPAPLASPPAGPQDACSLRQAGADSLDRVSNVFVDTAFRSTPWAQEAAESDSARTAARVLFVSESGVCRSVLAQALLRGALHARGLDDSVECEARGTRHALAKYGFAWARATMRPRAIGCECASPCTGTQRTVH